MIKTLVYLALSLVAVPVFGQEFGLQQYVQLLKVAPGSTVQQKVEFLTGIGVKLSSQGERDLEQASSSRNSAPIPRVTSRWTDPTEDSSARLNKNITGTSQRIGNQTYYNFSNGLSGNSVDVGNQTYQNFNNGLSGNSNRIGNQNYQNWNDGSSSNSNRVGNTVYQNFNNGVTGTSTQVGNTTYHNFSNGRNCTTTRIGTQTNTNCY